LVKGWQINNQLGGNSMKRFERSRYVALLKMSVLGIVATILEANGYLRAGVFVLAILMVYGIWEITALHRS
jgi:hypothetical protein